MANDIGTQGSVNGTSMNLNNQPGQGTQKPSASAGKADPGGTKPPMEKDGAVPMPK
jgi:hypothetical protein